MAEQNNSNLSSHHHQNVAIGYEYENASESRQADEAKTKKKKKVMVQPETLVLRGEEAAQAYEAERKQIPQDILVPRDSLVREVRFHV